MVRKRKYGKKQGKKMETEDEDLGFITAFALSIVIMAVSVSLYVEKGLLEIIIPHIALVRLSYLSKNST